MTINDAFSELKAVLAGGSVLGPRPTLFLVFINDLFDVVSNELGVYADDSSLWCVVPDGERGTAAASLNADLAAIQSWAGKWLVTYNDTKTELLTISHKKDMTEFRKNGLNKKGFILNGPMQCPQPPLIFYGNAIPERPNIKVVGVTFSSDLTWTVHINSIVSKAKRSLFLLRRASSVLNPTALQVLFTNHMFAHAWSTAARCGSAPLRLTLPNWTVSRLLPHASLAHPQMTCSLFPIVGMLLPSV